VISKSFSIEVNKFKPWLQKETVGVLHPLKEKGGKLVEKVKVKLEDAREPCRKLEEEADREIQKGHAVRKAKLTQRLSRYFLKEIDGIVFPDGTSYRELDKLHSDLQEMISSILRERDTWFSRISPMFIITRKRVDFALGRLTGSISDLRDFISSDYSVGKIIGDLYVENEETISLLGELRKLEKEKRLGEEKVESFQKKMVEIEQRTSSIKQNRDLADLSTTRLKVNQLRKAVKHDLRHLAKPLKKFANLTRGPTYALSSDETMKLSQYLNDPFFALATEKPSYPILKSILRKVEHALGDGKLRLKSSRLRKFEDSIEVILNKNKLDSLHQSCLQAFSLNQQLTSSEETKLVQKQLKQIQTKLTELKRKKEAADTKLTRTQREYKNTLENVEKKKDYIERSASDLLDRDINLII